jgi:beta-phosphoglucomutase
MTDIKACIFDLDGVIVDTARYHYQAWRRLANSLGFDFTEADNEHLKGVSRAESLRIILSLGGVSLPEAEQEALAAKKNDWYVALISQVGAEELLPGARAFLEALRAAGYKIALGSASKNARTILERTGILPLFDAVIDGNHTTKGKPDPQVFLMGAEALGLPPEACVVFEDAQKGIEAARNGGFPCVGIGDPGTLAQADRVLPGLHAMRVEDLPALARA